MSESHVTEQTSVQSTSQAVNITQLPLWMVSAITHQVKDEKTGEVTSRQYAVRANDLKQMYLLFLWEYLSKHHVKGDVGVDTPALDSDDTKITLPIEDLVRLGKIYFKFKSSFDSISYS